MTVMTSNAVAEDIDWKSLGHCTEFDPDGMFPDHPGPAPSPDVFADQEAYEQARAAHAAARVEYEAQVRDAKAVCRGEAPALSGACPVLSVCLRHAIEMNERHGIWGAKTRGERVHIGRRQAL